MKISGAKGLVSVFPLLVLYRLLALGIAIVQITLANPFESYSPISSATIISYFPISSTTIIFIASIYTLLIILISLMRVRQKRDIAYGYLLLDILACIGLVFITGGISSPFLLYTLSPILTVSLSFKSSLTIVVATASVAYVIISHLVNPFSPTELHLVQLSYFTVYIIAVTLAATLPYMINVNLRQRLHSESIINERQRISRELHDGVVQTLTMLRWRIQIFQRRLLSYPAELQEVKQLEKLVEKAQYDAREALEVMHYTSYNSRFLPNLREALESLRLENQINVKISSEFKDIALNSKAEIELLRICQEALANIRKHSNAKNVHVNISTKNGRFILSITDDGCGFHFTTDDKIVNLHLKTYGLAVMRERAGLIGGKLHLESTPGQGTVVQVEIPRKINGDRVLWQKR